jgi:hypothetical protein
MTIHHDSNTCCGGTCCDAGQPVATTQIGMDMVIYKLTKDGAPVSVFAVDTMPVDGITNGISNKDPAAGGSVNGGSGGFSVFGAIDTFEKSGNPTHLVVAGRHRGRLITFIFTCFSLCFPFPMPEVRNRTKVQNLSAQNIYCTALQDHFSIQYTALRGKH